MLDIRIAKPCDQTWTAMRGDDRVRHCLACRKDVYNISEMTEAEVEALIRRTEGRFCARVYRRTDGRVLTADCPRGVAAVRRRRTLAVTAAMTAAVGVLWPVLQPSQGKPAVRVQMGKLRVEPSVAPEYETGDVFVPESSKSGKYEVQMGAPRVEGTKP